jgi:hypothetical protein
VRLGRFAEQEQRPGQRNSRIHEYRPAVRERKPESAGRRGRVIGKQPLFTRSQERLGPRHRRALRAGDGKPAHPLRGGFMISAKGGVELYGVKFLAAQNRHDTERTHPDRAFNARVVTDQIRIRLPP